MTSTREEILARLTAPGAPFEIRTEDVRGVPLQVFANRHRTLGELLGASARFGEREYLVTEDASMSFAEHLAAVGALAAALRERYGIGKGDRVAICSANSPQWIVLFWATVSLGAIAVGLNSLWVAPEIEHGLRLSKPKAVFTDAARRPLVGEPGVPVVGIEDEMPALLDEYKGAPLPADVNDEDDPAAILFTSGTTGRAKGATHSHRNFVAACWFHLLNDALATEMGFAPQPGRRYLLISPLFHISTLHNLAVVRLVTGDTAVIYQGRFEPDRLLRLLEHRRVTNWGAVPTLLARLLEHPDLGRYNLGALRTVSVNSAPSSPALKNRIRERLPLAARSLGTSYGLTESSTAATVATPDELLADPDTVGRAVPTMQVQICDEASEPVPDGVEGEICLRGPLVMIGYWNDPQATAAATTPDGWFRTGDLGTMRGGALSVSSRRSDLILRGAENIYPAEIEYQLAEHPAVRECIVFGVPHPDLGEEPAAVVVRRADQPVDEHALREFLAGRLARYKIPSRWLITTEELPRNATGKVKRHEIGWP